MSDDARLDASALLGELDWLRRLARSLVGTVGAEQDLVQQTWLAASQVEGGVSRPWLVSTLRRLAARWHRSESRLRRREQAVARPEAVETTALLERSELLGTVLSELRAVEEPYRTTLMLLYQEGLSVRESAERLGVREDTLRWRHREGLKRLRARLDRGARDDWRSALLPLVGAPTLDLAQGGAAAATTVPTSTVIWGTLMSSKLGALAALATILVPLALWARKGGPEEPSRLAVEPALSSEPRLAEPEWVEDAPVDEVRREVAEKSAVAHGPVAASPPTSGRVLEVTLINGANAPVPGAQVWLGGTPDPVDLFWESDAKGIARVPMPGTFQGDVSARTETLYGTRGFFCEASGGELKLRLLSDADLGVLVVDEKGTPLAGVPVAMILTKRLQDRVTKAERDMLNFRQTVETNEAGRALLRHVNHHLRNGSTADWWIGPAVLLKQRDDQQIALDDLPQEPVRLVLPPVGPLTVRALSDTGALNPNATEARVLIDPNHGQQRDVAELVNEARFSPTGIATVELNNGVGRLPMVGLGLQLLAEAREAEPTESTFGFGPGPTTAGEAPELVLQPRDTAIEIVGHALDAAGSALANCELTGDITFAQGRGFAYRRFNITTDSSGRFRIFLDDRSRQDWGRYEDRKLNLLHMGSDPTDVLGANCSLSGPLPLGARDVGELNLEPMTPLLAGTTRTEEGKPIDLQYIQLVVRDALRDRRKRLVLDAREVTTEGYFALYGTYPEVNPALGEELVLQLTPKDRPGRKQRVSPGDLDLEFVFEDAGYLEGRVLLQPGQDPDDYYVRFQAQERPGDYGTHLRSDLAQNGRFYLKGLPHRIGDVEVRDWATQTLFAIVPGVAPVNESNVEHPLLGAIELQGSLDEYSLQVIDMEGNGIRQAGFESPSLPLKHSAFGPGKFRWRAAGGSLDGVVSAPGYRSQPLTLFPGEKVVTLEQGPEVVLRLNPAPELPDGAQLLLELARSGSPESVPLYALGDGSYSGFVASPGEYQVRGRLTLRGMLVAELPLTSASDAGLPVKGTIDDRSLELPFDNQAILDRLEDD